MYSTHYGQHITEITVFNECDKTEQWLQDKFQLQNSLPHSSDPVVWSHEIKERTASLDALCFISPLTSSSLFFLFFFPSVSC
ncbi:hypothetical protein IHE45_15G108800 [Dioscorea alata]|uniref:Uncharacterized protein n=1 Tax=Dioscorea alata TaxID=55571 RepID=A0ACB7UNQ8_DIOAL|nr:hypothetical protein IHE45_15G108800 [Dioscorea alata]